MTAEQGGDDGDDDDLPGPIWEEIQDVVVINPAGRHFRLTGRAARGGPGVIEAARNVIEGLAKQNGVTLGRVLGRGNVGMAEEGPGGKMYATIRIPMDEFVFDPGVLILPHGGDLELEIINDDNNTHCALLPSNGDSKFIWLVNFSKGRASLQLDGPGYYWYGSRTGNDEGKGLTGVIVVGGEVPDEAKLDRPPQPRP
jgi:PQQ system protein